ncbi:jmjC domain-containing protein 8 isoform X2 [Gopherus flavomarginatus]|uniref:jmjC domain-containing protein 8 isoform X2 n=1 Tax=Gopherus flavomarginatus TaxID=286002 RepID=UPI0021CB9C1A|nr:jmjC domain-containing protein 8 isoform X2 [Gopherus flavomarginatus]
MGSWWQFLLLSIPVSLPGNLDYLEGNGGWFTNKYLALMEEDHCTVERRDASLTYSQFIDQYAFSRPVIIQGITDNSEFQALCTRNKLLAEFGDRLVRLSTANTYSYHKDTLYFFGDNNFTEWGSLFQKYMPPPFQIPGTSGAYSFGIAGSGSGVPFHWHGPGYSEVIFGRKRWFLYPPEKTPEFHPNKTTLAWLLDTYPFLPPEERPVECTIHPGEGRAEACVNHCSSAMEHQQSKGAWEFHTLSTEDPSLRQDKCAVFPRSLVARHPQLGHKCLHLHLPGVETQGFAYQPAIPQELNCSLPSRQSPGMLLVNSSHLFPL